ncbi:endoribonuclease Dicer-like [Gigantopelta aegis]|uniref:endoribonuclease Dicer-like n=1 Tax=Gigantopelta aegis TaxID=1735272 RepID=UPI001B888214|nr:endoribonuclease Dicer-like [Gigantopelta aegis]
MVKVGPEFAKKLPKFLRHEDIPTDTFTPRTYQVELLDSALHQNTIVCLGSSSGKAFIALLVIKELAHHVRPTPKDGGKRTLYVSVSEVAAENQFLILQHHTDLTVGKYTIDDNIESWLPDKWQQEMGSHQVLIMTADACQFALENHHLSLSDISLLIIDDCHYAVDNHSYIHIMKYTEQCTNPPQILGLTTSILSSRCHDPHLLRNTITSLETTLHSRAETSMLVTSERYGSRPKEFVYECKSREDSTGLVSKIGTIIENAIYFLHDCKIDYEAETRRDPRRIPENALCECHNILYRLGPWCAARIAEMLVTQLEKIDKNESITLHKRFLRYGASQMRLITSVFEQNFTPDYDVDQLLEYTTPKVSQLIRLLRKYKPELDFMIISNDDMEMSDDSDMSDDDSMDLSDSDDDYDKSTRPSKQIHIAVKRGNITNTENNLSNIFVEEEKHLVGVVFVEQRYVAFALNKMIEEVCAWDENLCFLRSSHVTNQRGRSRVVRKETGKSYRKQEEVLRKFRMQDLNLLVSTNVLEEGVDIPKCNLVVRFDPPRDYKSYTLSKGRARARAAEYVILIDEDKKKTFSEELAIFKGIEEVLIGIGRGIKDQTEVEEELDPVSVVNLLPPYLTKTEFGSPQVTMLSAIGLVNRYCAKLPSDAFTHLTPHCMVSQLPDSVPPLYHASLRLPVNSPIKEEILGPAMPSKKLSKMAVALKMCEILHKAGELDDNLMPVGKEMFMYEEDEEWDDEEDLPGQARPGTTKRKQYYFKKSADAFINSHLKADEPCYLYHIYMELTGPITDEQNTRGRRIYAPEKTTQSFGIFTTKPIPNVPTFPVYTRSGKVTVSIQLLKDDARIGQADLDKVRLFHQFVFNSVLHLEKDPMEFSPDSSDVGYLLVPLNTAFSSETPIEWDFIDLVKTSLKTNVDKKTARETKKEIFQFKQEDFSDAVVMPSYRNIDQPQHFYVAEICHDLSPLSPFPSPELYKTFNEYYTTKYGLSITNTEQPLLDVDHTSARLNLLTPRYMNQKGVALPTSSAETKRARRENLQQKQILVPELCDIHVFPASLWRKAVCLPAVLYRLNYLLLAEEIRKRIAKETGIGIVDLPEGFTFPQLDFGFETSPEKLKVENAAESEGKASVISESPCSSVSDLHTSSQVTECKADNQLASDAESQNSPCETAADKVVITVRKSSDDKGDLSSDSDSGIISNASDSSCFDTGDSGKPDGQNNNIRCSNSSSETNTVPSDGPVVGTEVKPESHEDTCFKQHLLKTSECSALPDHTAPYQDMQNDLHLDATSPDVASTCSEMCHDVKHLPHNNNIQTDVNFVCLCDVHSCNSDTLVPSTVAATSSNCEHNSESVKSEWLQSSSLTNNENPSAIIHHDEHSSTDHWKESDTSSSVAGVDGSQDPSTVEAHRTADTQVFGENNDSASKSDKDSGTNKSADDLTNCDTKPQVFQSNAHNLNQDTDFGMWGDSGVTNKKKKTVEKTDEEEVYTIPNILMDEDRDLSTFVGPTPCLLLQALTMSNANDFFSLERLETIGDSFLKYAITVYLYCTYPGIHEGKLSYLRSKQVSNYNLYRLGRKSYLAECMVSSKFEPYENWLPPCYVINEQKRRGPVPKVLIANLGYKTDRHLSNFVFEDAYEEVTINSKKTVDAHIPCDNAKLGQSGKTNSASEQHSTVETLDEKLQRLKFEEEVEEIDKIQQEEKIDDLVDVAQCLIPYSLQTQHGIPDKSVADCVEALIGCYLTTCGKKAALLFMSWLGLKVLSKKAKADPLKKHEGQQVSEFEFEELKCPQSPLLRNVSSTLSMLNHLLDGYEVFEQKIHYTFNDRSYLLQAFTHASYHYNTITDCYQRLEFLGDAILDYVITRHLYEDSEKYSPGILTDLRSALVNNNIFAALAVKWDFHKYFKSISPALFHVIEKFVARQKEKEDEIDIEEEFKEQEDDDEEIEEVELEIPKALGDIFESVAGAIYLDSGMSLDTVWRVYYGIMQPQIEKYLKSIPKSPVRELLEMEPETAKFEKPERTMEGKIRVTVNVVGKGVFSGIGRNYRIAKSAAAKKALRMIHTMQQQGLV